MRPNTYWTKGGQVMKAEGIKHEAELRHCGWEQVHLVPVDAIVIPRDSLPEVRRKSALPPEAGAGAARAVMRYGNPDSYLDYALSALAIAVSLREDPPVDEAQVDALTTLIDETYPGTNSGLARRLVERGVRVEETR